MSASRKLVVLATLIAIVSALAANAASAEPKNQWPFTRSVDSRVLGHAAREGSTLDVAPVPEAKNETPFTNQIGVRRFSSASGRAGATFAAAGGDSGGIDWTLAGFELIAAVTLAGGAAVALSSMRLPPHSRA